MVARTENLTLMRGDTAFFGVNISGLDGTPNAIYFSVKARKNAGNYVIQKSLGNGIDTAQAVSGLRYIVTIAPEDTERLLEGVYYYDIEISINGTVLTPLRGDLTLMADVTRHLWEGRP